MSSLVSKISGVQCCVPNCYMSRRKNKRMFEFNDKKYNLKEWLQFCNITIDDLRKRKYFICEDHFEQKYVSGTKLARNAFPTIKTGMSIQAEIITQDDLNLMSKENNFETLLPINSIVSLNDVNIVPHTIVESSGFKYLSLDFQNSLSTNILSDYNQNTAQINSLHNINIPSATPILPSIIDESDFKFSGLIQRCMSQKSSEQSSEQPSEQSSNETTTKNNPSNIYTGEEYDEDICNYSESPQQVNFSTKTYSQQYIQKSHPHLKEDLTFENLMKIPDPYFDRPAFNNDDNVNESTNSFKTIRKISYYEQKNRKLEKCLNLKVNECKELSKKHRLLMAKYLRLKKVVDASRNDDKKSIQDRITELPDNICRPAKILSGMILRPSKSKKQYSEDEKIIAQNMCFRSNKLYMFLRETLNIHLPSKSSINKWLPLKNMTSGFDKNLLERLRLKFGSMTELEKQSILMYDEIVIRNDLKFNEALDQIEGFVDLGSTREFKIGNYIQVFMIRGIFADFKFFFSYYVSENSMKGEDLLPLLFQNIDNATDVGALVRVIICDQGSGNCKAFSELGIAVTKPFFMYGDRKIYAMYDTPHLFKSIRNALINNNFICPEGIVSWDVIRDLSDMDRKSSATRACLKLTDKHINPGHFDKMKVRYAVQILSNSVADAITTVWENNLFVKPKSHQNAPSTASFIKKMNDLFDCLNSNCVSSSPTSFKTAFTASGATYLYLTEMMDYIKEIKIVNSPPVRCISGT